MSPRRFYTKAASARRRLVYASRVVRAPQWGAYKLGPLLGFAYAEVALHAVAPGTAAVLVGQVLACGVGLAAFGHVVNDAFDAEADRHAGKPNALAAWSPAKRSALAVALLAGAFVPWVPRPPGALALGLLALNALLLVAYAAPPLRLKTRGGWGVAADAAYAHLMPVLFVAAVFGGDEGRAGHAVWVGLAAGWAVAFGVRGILIHQLYDQEADAAVGAETFVVRAGAGRAKRLARAAFGVEGVALLGLAAVALLVLQGPARLVVGAAVGLVLVVLRAGPKDDPAPASRAAPVPLRTGYAYVPALVFGAALAATDARYAPLLVFAVACVGLLPQLPGRRYLSTARRAVGRSPLSLRR